MISLCRPKLLRDMARILRQITPHRRLGPRQLADSTATGHWRSPCHTSLRMRATRPRLTAVLSLLLLLLSGNFACWSQLLHPVAPEECCAKGSCKRMPGQPAHSSCHAKPANSDRVTPAQSDSITSPVRLVASSEVTRLTALPASASSASRPVPYSPPDLYLIHASFLI